MLKFKKDGKVVGILKDEATEPEGTAFNFTDSKEDADIETAEAETESQKEKSEDEPVE